MKTIHITEEQLKYLIKENLMKEMAYPSSWDIDEFREITTFKGRVQYCKDRLEYLGSGSSRMVFRIDNEKVLKLAKNNKGIAQNEAENDWYLQKSNCFTKVYDSDRNGLWIEAESAIKAKQSDFKKITGYGFDVMCAWIDYTYNCYSRQQHHVDEKYIQIFKSEEWENNYDYSVFGEISDYMRNYNINGINDLKRISSWGIVKRDGEDEIVLVDYGLNNSVLDFYYSR